LGKFWEDLSLEVRAVGLEEGGYDDRYVGIGSLDDSKHSIYECCIVH